MSAMKGQHIAIAGAGIAGCAAAIALAQKGASVTVLERAAAFADAGAGLQLHPCATRVIDALGLADEIRAIATVPNRIDFRQAKTGRVVIRGVRSNLERTVPHFQCHRSDLHALLLGRAESLGVAFKLGDAVSTFEPCGETVTVNTENGEAFSAQLLLGADGVRSQVREQLFGADEPQFTGQVAYRAMVDVTALGRDFHAGAVLGPGAHAVMYPLRQGRFVNLIVQMNEEHWNKESWTERGDVDELNSVVGGWDEQLDALLKLTSETYKWALFARKPLPTWSQGRVALMGDACHASLPNLGAGSAMALEDAWLMAELLDRAADPAEAFARLYQKRIKRCTRVQKGSARNAALFHLSHPVARSITYTGLSLVSHLLPFAMRAQLAWLQAYDITREPL